MTSDHAEPRDSIEIHGLALEARVGVPESERALPQRLLADLVLVPSGWFAALDDDIARTVDYSAAAKFIRGLASAGERRLIETLAEEICAGLLRTFPLRRVDLRLRKFILPDTEWVAVRLRRDRSDFT